MGHQAGRPGQCAAWVSKPLSGCALVVVPGGCGAGLGWGRSVMCTSLVAVHLPIQVHQGCGARIIQKGTHPRPTGNDPRFSSLLKRSGMGNVSDQCGGVLTFFPIWTIHLLGCVSFGSTGFLPYFAALAFSARFVALPTALLSRPK